MPFIDLPDRIPGFRAQAREPRPWYRITNSSADEAEVMLYDEVGGWLGATADEFIDELRGVTASKILLRVNSPGGSVTEGIAIANALRSHPANVTVQVDGIAASIASVIAMAGDQVRMMPNALLMVHEASGLCVGDSAEMIKMAEVLDKISGNIANAYATRAGGTVDEWRQVMRDETWYTAEEAVAAGLADEVAPARKQQAEQADDEPDMARAYDLAAYGYQGPQQEAPFTPPPAAPEPAPQLIVSLADLLGDEVVAKLRAAVQPEPEPAAAPVPEAVATVSPAHLDDAMGADDVADREPTAATEPEPEQPADDWTVLVAALIPDDADDWSALVNHLIEPDTSSSAATA